MHVGYPPPPSPPPPPRNDAKALLAVILGVLSVSCLGFVAGIPAIVLGSMARRDIDRSSGRLTGSKLAATGVVAGLFGTGAWLVLGLWLLGGAVDDMKQEAAAQHESLPSRTPAAIHTYGSTDVVDLDDRKPLETQLENVAHLAAAKDNIVVLQTYSSRSRECSQIAAALPDPRMQRALANVTLVRVDVDIFENELHALSIETASVPWFYMLDKDGKPKDKINADEWDENVPENMAPVLAKFVRGTLAARRVHYSD
jgi:hypothetical protein